MDTDKYLSEFLGFMKYKLDHGLCTMEEIEAAEKWAKEQSNISGRVEDFAEFYGKSKDAVFGIIKRNVVEKPKRNVVLYSFRAFSKKVPESWRKKH